jgi:transcription-repair coupling factor (superfamily II helicase)
LGVELGFEKMLLKNDSLKCYFINKPDSPYFESETFKLVLSFIHTETNKARLKHLGKIFLLIVDDINSMKDIHSFLKRMNDFVHKAAPVNVH